MLTSCNWVSSFDAIVILQLWGWVFFYCITKSILYFLSGSMAGMSRDKCGAADVAGFMKVVSILKPTNVKVIGAMAMVRNSIGSNAYVADEIVISRAGVRLRVGNTDAEGRMAMVDVLAHMKGFKKTLG